MQKIFIDIPITDQKILTTDNKQSVLGTYKYNTWPNLYLLIELKNFCVTNNLSFVGALYIIKNLIRSDHGACSGPEMVAFEKKISGFKFG